MGVGAATLSPAPSPPPSLKRLGCLSEDSGEELNHCTNNTNCWKNPKTPTSVNISKYKERQGRLVGFVNCLIGFTLKFLLFKVR